MSLFESIPEDSLLVSKNDPEDLLGSCSAYGFFLDDQDWPTAEHYYQAMKFDDPAYRETIRNAPDAPKARKLGNRWFKRKRPDFKQVRNTLMTRAIYTRARTYPKLSQQLLDTDDQYIAERSFTDYYWGCGRDGRGENHYGKVLMNVRTKLRQEQAQKTS